MTTSIQVPLISQFCIIISQTWLLGNKTKEMDYSSLNRNHATSSVLNPSGLEPSYFYNMGFNNSKTIVLLLLLLLFFLLLSLLLLIAAQSKCF